MTPIVLPQQSSRLSFQRASLMPRPPCACGSAANALSSSNLQNPPRISTPHHPIATIHPPTLFVRAANPSAYDPALN
jgi:hypothetical protein